MDKMRGGVEDKIEEKSNETAMSNQANQITLINDTLPSSLHECTLNHLIALITNNESFNDEKINPFKAIIIQYLKENQIDGNTLSNIKRKQFSSSVIKYFKNNDKLRYPANTIHKKLINLFHKVNIHYLQINTHYVLQKPIRFIVVKPGEFNRCIEYDKIRESNC